MREASHQKGSITLELNLTMRVPSIEYGFMELNFNGFASPGDLKRFVSDIDGDFTAAIGNAYNRALSTFTIGNQLGGQVSSETNAPAWPTEPAWSGGYEGQSAPVSTYQAPQAYEPPAPAWLAQPAPQAPQAVQVPTCQHGPAKLVPAGISKSTNNPYNAFWACQAPQGAPKCKMPKYA